MWTSMPLQAVTAVLAAVALCGAFPTQIYKQATSPGAFIGEGINHIATALLQDTEQQGNAAFSPLGHSAILAALAEGASGKTRAQLLTALMLPQDSSLTRATYRSVLGRMKEKNAVSKPEFRSWFYVYKKSAQVEESYTNTLRDNYLMEVRDIESVELDTPTEFFTKKEQEVQQSEKLDETEPIVDENKVSAVPIIAEAAQAAPSVEQDQKEPLVAVPVVPVPVTVPVPQHEVPAVVENAATDKDVAANPQDDPVKAPAVQEAVIAVPVAMAEADLEPAAMETPESEVKKDTPLASPAESPAAADGDLVTKKESDKQDEAVAETAQAPAIVSDVPVVKPEADLPIKLEQDMEKTPVVEIPVVPEADVPKEPEKPIMLPIPAPVPEQVALPEKLSDQVPVVEAMAPPLPALPVDQDAAIPTPVMDSPPAKEELPVPAAPAEASPAAPIKDVHDIPAAESGDSPAAPQAEGVVTPEHPVEKPPAPVEQGSAVLPAMELLPPMEDANKMKDDVRKEVAEEMAKPEKAEEATAVKLEETKDKITAEAENSDPANELHKEEVGEMLEKISLAKFSKQGLPKDEKKPTNVGKPEKKKDEKKKASRNSADADTDGRQPASGPSLLTAFNALYYKGIWQTPFDAKYRDDFFVGGDVKKEVTVLRTQGDFRIGDIKELDAKAIELPYKGESGRYSLLVVLPRAQDGLAKLTEALSRFSFRQLSKYMRQKHVDVAIPEFEIDCISHPQNVFRKLGVTSMLDKESAEFPGISKAQRLFLQDDAMAQLVRFRLDDDTAVANYLSTMSMTTRSGNQVFQANHPFIFYLRDNLDNLTIVVGKVVDPSIRPEFSGFKEE